MAQAHAAHDDHHDHDAHSPQHYVKIWGILLVLLVVSIAGPEVAKYAGSAGVWITLITAFGIAFVKAWLVIKHFMHLTIEKPIVWYILITCLVFLVLFFAGVAPDVKNHDGTNWTNLAAKAEIERALAEQKAAHGDGHGGEHQQVDPTMPEEAKPPVPEDVEPPAPAAPAPKKFSELTTDAQKKSWLMKRGEKVYADAACITCHRSNGAGHGPFPTLVGAEAHSGDCAMTKKVLTSAGPVATTDGAQVQHPAIGGSLAGEDLAAVATYVRNSWGNELGVCAP